MITFIQQTDALGLAINKACNELFVKIPALDIDSLPFEPYFKWYFKKCHLGRPHFSLKTSARLLYNAIQSTGKPWQNVVIMDYGAGLGTLYLIAKIIGVKKIIYNDLMPEFATPAAAVDAALGYPMDEYIIGDTEATLQQLKKDNIICDVIVSRNVLEHIYHLPTYYNLVQQHQPQAILYNSTTANYNNPLAHVQHIYLHYKAKPALIQRKIIAIHKVIPDLNKNTATKLATALIQYGSIDFDTALQTFVNKGTWPTNKKDYTNVCDETGNWREHLLSYKQHQQVASNYKVTFVPGFWDVDYKNPLLKTIGIIGNAITNMLGSKGYVAASFIYIIAKPK